MDEIAHRSTHRSGSGSRGSTSGRSIGSTVFNRLLLVEIILWRLLKRVGDMNHIYIACPSQWHTYQHRTVPVAPAYVGRGLLVGYQAQGTLGRRLLIHVRDLMHGGAALPEPVRLDCGPGLLALGDWSHMTAEQRGLIFSAIT